MSVPGLVDGRDLATDGTKLDGIEAGADVTDAANVGAAISNATDETTIASGDKIGFLDNSDSEALKPISVSNLMISRGSISADYTINDLTADA